MECREARLLQRIESDREVLLDFFCRFIRCPTSAASNTHSRLAPRAVDLSPDRSVLTAGMLIRRCLTWGHRRTFTQAKHFGATQC
jgi:hypothetical protein